MAEHAGKCVACGSEDLLLGSATPFGGTYGVKVGYSPGGFMPRGTVINACLDCGHLNWALSEQALTDLREARTEARTVEIAGQVAEELRTRAKSGDMLDEIRDRVSEGSPSLEERDR